MIVTNSDVSGIKALIPMQSQPNPIPTLNQNHQFQPMIPLQNMIGATDPKDSKDSIPTQSMPHPIPQFSFNPPNSFQKNQLPQIPQPPQPFGIQFPQPGGQSINPHQQFLHMFGQDQPQMLNKVEAQNNMNDEDDEIIIIEQKVPNENLQEYDLENNLTFEIKTSYKYGKLQNSATQYLPGIISLKAKDIELQPDKQPRVGVDLICLLDKSGSMQGEKVEMVKKTLNVLLDYLTEKDRLQIITFDSCAKKLTPLKKVNDSNKQQIKNIISNIQAGGCTTIGEATKFAFESLKNRKQRNNVTSIFILSDGQDDKAEMAVKEQLQNVNEVLTIHSFGFGRDHDAKMMAALCNLGKGSFYFVQDITLLDEYFADALGGLISVVGSKISIEAKCTPASPFQDIYLQKTYGDAWVQVQNQRQYLIEIPQISSGSRRDFVFEIGLPKSDQKIDDQNRNVQIIEAQLQITDPNNGKVYIKNAELIITFFNEDENINNNQQDYDVTAQYFRIKATQTIQEANRKCEQNRNEEAQKLLENMIVQIKNNQNVATLSQGVLTDLDQALQGAKRQHYRAYGQQQMFQMAQNNFGQQGMNANFQCGAQFQPGYQQQYQNNAQFCMQQQVNFQKQRPF